MTWAKFDDRMDDNRKVKKAWRQHPRAVGLHSMAITYCSRHETDGLVDVEWLHEKLPDPAEYTDVLAVLVDTGLFDTVDDDHYRVHDYLEYNPARQDLESKRAKDRERKAVGGRKESPKTPGRVQQDSARNPSGSNADSGSPGPARPVPSQPGPARPPETAAASPSPLTVVPPPPPMLPHPDLAAKLLQDAGVQILDAYQLAVLHTDYPTVDLVAVAHIVIKRHRERLITGNPFGYFRGIVTSSDAPKLDISTGQPKPDVPGLPPFEQAFETVDRALKRNRYEWLFTLQDLERSDPAAAQLLAMSDLSDHWQGNRSTFEAGQWKQALRRQWADATPDQTEVKNNLRLLIINHNHRVNGGAVGELIEMPA